MTDNAEDLDIVMSVYNLIEYCKNYSKTSGTLWNYYKYTSIDPITNSESFKYKTVLQEKPLMNAKEVEFFVPLKHLCNFWRTLDRPLINCELSLTLTWSKYCVLTDITTRAAGIQGNPPAIEVSTGARFTITDAKLYVPVVTLSTEDDDKLLQQLKAGFKIRIKWNKYRSEITNQAKTDPT